MNDEPQRYQAGQPEKHGGYGQDRVAAARRVGGVTVCPISSKVSSTTVTILRMTALIASCLLLSLP